jgi:hypothetical protein
MHFLIPLVTLITEAPHIDHNERVIKAMKRLIILLAIMSCILSGCQDISFSGTPTPPPGWRKPVSDNFVDETIFPTGWHVDYTDPKGKDNDPTINHVFRQWGGKGAAWQNIWRAYSVTDAQDFYSKIRKSQFTVNGTPTPDKAFSEFSVPLEVKFSSQIADDYYFACSQWNGSHCEVVARYKNYVTDVYLPLRTDAESNEDLTYPQMETILINMDHKFGELIKALYK